jgi:hypothetical protein
LLFAVLVLVAVLCRTNTNNGQQSNYRYNLLPGQKATESVGYFVLEHQPDSCSELPPNGKVSWTNISVEVNNIVVQNPVWVAQEENPACKSKAVVNSPTSIDIVWGTTSNATSV